VDGGEERECKKVGMWREDSHRKWDAFEEDV